MLIHKWGVMIIISIKGEYQKIAFTRFSVPSKVSDVR